MVSVWGTGTPRREFLHVDDLADALLFLMERYADESPVNVGWGEDLTIHERSPWWRAGGVLVGSGGGLSFDPGRPLARRGELSQTTKPGLGAGWRPAAGGLARCLVLGTPPRGAPGGAVGGLRYPGPGPLLLGASLRRPDGRSHVPAASGGNRGPMHVTIASA